MAQVMTDTQLQTPQKRKVGDDGLINLADWLEAEEETEDKAGAIRLADEPTKKKSKKGLNVFEATTIVTGRPTTNNIINTDDLLSFTEPHAPATADLGGKNWVGQLFEYRQAHPFETGPDYNESSPYLNLFTCFVSIGEHLEPLGNPRAIFSRKKDAKQYAAKLAVEWLIANKHMPSSGSVSFPKPRPQQPTPKSSPGPRPQSAQSSGSPNDDPNNANAANSTSFGQRVAVLCGKLGMCPPSYVVTPRADFTAMYSGYALFDSSSMVIGKVGEFSNVHGRKKAKEACAEKVLEFLEGIATMRAARPEMELVERGMRVPDSEREEYLLD